MSKKLILGIVAGVGLLLTILIIGVAFLVGSGSFAKDDCYNLTITAENPGRPFNPSITYSAFNTVGNTDLSPAESPVLYSGENFDGNFVIEVYEDKTVAYTKKSFTDFTEDEQLTMAKDMGALYGATIIDINSDDTNDFAQSVQDSEDYQNSVAGWNVDFKSACKE